MSVTSLSTRSPRLGLSVNDFFEPWNEWLSDGASGRSLSVPHVNITEDKSGYFLSLAAPGLDKKDFRIDVDGNILTISSRKEESKEEKNENYTRHEYNYSSFSRSFTLPEEVKLDKIEAHYEDGVLKLALPKNEKAAHKNHKAIPIK